jgi:hypothetical protein
VIVFSGSVEWPRRHAFVVEEALDAALDRHPVGSVELLVPDGSEGAELYAVRHWDSFGGPYSAMPEGRGDVLATLGRARAMTNGNSTIEVVVLPWGRSTSVRALARAAVNAGLRVTTLEGSEIAGCSPPSARPGKWS